ncbi:5592_t:CDS:2 [Dentiscutata erythropus]|uniref:5592_t:CDS:1 n=1 Tax=Dentiscutata erythropus TaxID=1348616 RepID=A0A9N9GS38_9GLOM|nr:5592_t:CDS:2 [Dentiscutata erythropus]
MTVVVYSKIVNQINTIDAVPLPLVIAKDKHDPTNYIVKSQWFGLGHNSDDKITHILTCKDKSVKVKHTHQVKNFSDYEAHYEIKVPKHMDTVLCERVMKGFDNEFLGYSSFSFKHTS